MAIQICPKCEEDNFTWHIDELNITTWGCSCGYRATEDESLETTCDLCGKKTKSFMSDDECSYWWCSSCNKTWKQG